MNSGTEASPHPSAFGAAPGALVPGPGPVAAWMHRGLDAATFTGEARGLAVFIKQLPAPDTTPAAFAAASDAAARAAELGIAPRLLDVDAAAMFLVFEDVSATHVAALRPWFDDAANVKATLDRLGRWHDAGVAGRPCTWLAGLSEGQARVAARAAATSGPEGALLPSWSRIADLVSAVVAALADPPEARPLHGEVLMSNVLRPRSGDGLPLLCDFDRSVNGDPVRDIAALWLEVSGRLADLESFAALAGLRNDAARRLPLWAVAEDLGWGFWAWEAHFERADPAVEYFKYARFRLNRALMNGVRLRLLPMPEGPAW